MSPAELAAADAPERASPAASGKLRVVITANEEPVLYTPYLSAVIRGLPGEVVEVVLARGQAVHSRKQSRWSYYLAIAIMSSPWFVLKSTVLTLASKICDAVPALRDRNPWSLRRVCRELGIPVREAADLNAPEFLDHLRSLDPDLLINQANTILKEPLLAIPRIGALNRHGSLLPKYRGCVAPFWALLHGDAEAGVSVHFIVKRLDAGPIVTRRSVMVGRFESLTSLNRKLYRLAPEAMIEAVDRLRAPDYSARLIVNDDAQSSYFTNPTPRDALRYRWLLLRRWLGVPPRGSTA